MRYSCDFETTTDPKDCRVWAWASCEIDPDLHFEYGNSLDSFMDWAFSKKDPVIYFHNLKFDGEFILSWLFKNGYEYDKKKHPKTFNCLISGQGQFYSIEIIKNTEKPKNRGNDKVLFYDSLKKLPMSVHAVASSFKLEENKLKIDYTAKREQGHELTSYEIDYIRNDVVIIAKALLQQFGQGLLKMTAGSDALSSFKSMMGGEKKFRKKFPILPRDMDDFIRKGYKGGWTYLQKEFKGKPIGKGIVFDVNSLYPWAMYDNILPYGIPTMFKGEYTPNKEYPLYIKSFNCSFSLKSGKLPTIQIKKNPFFIGTEYLEKSVDEVTLTMTNVDFELFKDQYDIYNYTPIEGFMFKGLTGVFKDYIDYWMNVKANSEGGLRQLAKLMLNSLYGKFATNPDVTGKIPAMDRDGILHYLLGDPESRDPVYTAMGCFITAYARNKTIRTAQELHNKGRFIYADTDSVHLTGTPIPDNIDVDPKKLGWWKHESTFEFAKFLQQKRYMEAEKVSRETYWKEVFSEDRSKTMQIINEEHYYLNTKCAGMQDSIKLYMTWEKFELGYQCDRLMPVHREGGITLENRVFTLK